MCTDRARAALGALLVVIAIGVAPSGALAQEAPESASDAPRLFREGVSLLERGEFEAACSVLARALELEPRASTAFNLASAELGAGRPVRARALLSRIGAGELGAMPEGFEGALAALEARVGAALARVEITARGAPRAEVLVDDEAVGVVTEGATISRELDPGTHHIVGRADGFAEAREAIDLSPGATARVLLALTASAPPPALAPDPVESPSDTPVDEGGGRPWLFVGIGTAVVVAAAIVVAVVLSTQGSQPRLDCDTAGCIDT